MDSYTVFRRRIDGLNFTGIRPRPDLSTQSKKSAYITKHSYLLEFVIQLSRIYEEIKQFAKIQNNNLVIDLTSEKGLYMQSYFKGQDQFFILQFKGYFFTVNTGIEECQKIIRGFSETICILRPTQIDIAQDFVLPVSKILPPPDIRSDNYKYCFRYKCRRFTNQDFESTGYCIESGRFKITVYDKLAENKHTRNKEKKAYYDTAYTGCNHVTRVELRLKQEYLRDLLESFYSRLVLEEDLIALSIKKFVSRHSLRLRPQNKDNDFRRWPIHPLWINLFGDRNSLTELQRTVDDRYSSGAKDATKHFEIAIEAMLQSHPGTTYDHIVQAIKRFDLDRLRSKVLNKQRERQTTTERLSRVLKRVKTRDYDGGWLDPTGGGDLYNIPTQTQNTLSSDLQE